MWVSMDGAAVAPYNESNSDLVQAAFHPLIGYVSNSTYILLFLILQQELPFFHASLVVH